MTPDPVRERRLSPAHASIDPATIRLLQDRALIRDLGSPEREGIIWIPERCRDRGVDEWGSLRIGLVLAIGPGDSFIELGYDDDAGVRRKLITRPCGCGPRFDIRKYETVLCPRCAGSGREPVVVPPQCQPGDRVLYSRRREAEFVVDGERLSLVNAEQSVLAVLEEE